MPARCAIAIQWPSRHSAVRRTSLAATGHTDRRTRYRDRCARQANRPSRQGRASGAPVDDRSLHWPAERTCDDRPLRPDGIIHICRVRARRVPRPAMAFQPRGWLSHMEIVLSQVAYPRSPMLKVTQSFAQPPNYEKSNSRHKISDAIAL